MHVTAYPSLLTAVNARELMEAHDLVLDCTDNVMTRYLVSDAAVLAGKQVVSGAAQGYDGQLVVLHKDCGEVRGPCYRCLFPEAPRPEHTQSCDDGGVLGPITGLIGTLQALETIKLLTGVGEKTQPTMLFVSPFGATPFRTVRVRPRQLKKCRACGDPALVKRIKDLTHEDYVSFCQLTSAPTWDVRSVPPDMLQTRSLPEGDALVLDVRPEHEYALASLPSIHIPIHTLRRDVASAARALPGTQPVLVVCRSGNDSREAVHLLQTVLPERTIVNVAGGLRAYATVDSAFFMY